jgi:hypothetical protein
VSNVKALDDALDANLNSSVELDDADVPLLQTLVAQKAKHSGMQVLIAVGGWDFS